MVDGNSGKSHENVDDLDVATIFGNLQILHFVDGFHPNPPKKSTVFQNNPNAGYHLAQDFAHIPTDPISNFGDKTSLKRQLGENPRKVAWLSFFQAA